MTETLIELVSPTAAAVIDPIGGATITHFGEDLSEGSNVLAHYDWQQPIRARDGGRYGDTRLEWLSDYRGGWQLLTPNAGEAAELDGAEHPFHGEVSRAPWRVERRTATSVTMSVDTNGPLIARRTISVGTEAARISASTTLHNPAGPTASAILVEHIAFKGGDGDAVSAPGSSRWAPGALESRGGSGFARLVGGVEGHVEFTSPGMRTARVEWDPRRLPFLWHWQERRSEGFPWFGRADIVGLEPASASNADGLAAAVARGEAWSIGAGESVSAEVSILLLPQRA